MFCSNCGAFMPDGSSFCPKCGSRASDIFSDLKTAKAGPVQKKFRPVTLLSPFGWLYFNERISRKEFLIRLLLLAALFFAASFFLTDEKGLFRYEEGASWYFLGQIFGVIAFLSICARRLHDIHRSGWWLLLIFPCPYIVLIAIPLLCIIPSSSKPYIPWKPAPAPRYSSGRRYGSGYGSRSYYDDSERRRREVEEARRRREEEEARERMKEEEYQAWIMRRRREEEEEKSREEEELREEEYRRAAERQWEEDRQREEEWREEQRREQERRDEERREQERRDEERREQERRDEERREQERRDEERREQERREAEQRNSGGW